MLLITTATLKNLSPILEIEQASFKHSWSTESLAGEFSDPLSTVIIAKPYNCSNIYGFCCYKTVPPEAELLRIAVRPEKRRQGIAKVLLDEVLRLLHLQQVTTVFLEVSETNRGAIALYKNSGFLAGGSRPGYYNHGTAAALLLRRNL